MNSSTRLPSSIVPWLSAAAAFGVFVAVAIAALPASASTVHYRVNAGGSVLTGEPGWEADNEQSRSPYVLGAGNEFGASDTAVAVGASVPKDVPAALFETTRYDTKKGGTGEMEYRFPVPNGAYEVRLYFSENYEGRAYERGRVFDVIIEDRLVLNDHDTFAEAGFKRGIMKSFVARSIDGDIHIKFRREINQPRVMGIEILPASSDVTEGRLRYYISPTGEGARDGSNWENAGTLYQLETFVAAASPGAQIWLRSDQGNYELDSTITLEHGGKNGKRLMIRGVTSNGSSNKKAKLIGTRSDPYHFDGQTGSSAFRLLAGADHLAFYNLEFVNIGNGAVRIGGDISDLLIDRVKGRNVRRLVESYRSGEATSASVSGLVVRRTVVDGYSKGAIRLLDNSHDILIEDVMGDSQRQDGDPFAIGVHLDDTVHDVMLRRVTMRNSHDSTKGPEGYWNGDGFATEGSVYNVTFVDTSATGSTDGGYDIKSQNTRMIRPHAADNKRNFRFWADDTVVEDCVGESPRRRGGSGSQAQVHLTSEANVVMTGCTLSDNDPGTVVYHIENGSTLTVSDDSVAMNQDAELSREEGGTIFNNR